MAEIVNLRAVKKQASRKAKRAEADANALKFGRSKARRALEKAQADKVARDLEAHRREPE